MSGNNSQQPQVDLNQSASITLPLGAWNTVLSLIAKGPWDVADPLMNVMRAQIQQNMQQPPQMPPRLRTVEEAGC